MADTSPAPRTLAVVAAEFIAGGLIGGFIGMRLACPGVKTLTNNLAILHDHAAHRRVRPDIAQAPPRQPQRVVHVAQVGGHSDAGRSSDTKRSKSSAAWKFL